MQIANIDSFFIDLDFFDYEITGQSFLSYLELKKQESKSIDCPVLVTIGDFTFTILSTGKQGFAYILNNSDYQIDISQFLKKSDSFYPVSCRIKSEKLWSTGLQDSWLFIKKLLESVFGDVKKERVKQIDLCCHTDSFKISKASDLDLFKGKFTLDVLHRDNRICTGASFGSSSSKTCYCRIYDKTKEVKVKNNKLWFYDIWDRKGLDPNKVWNVEYAVMRGFLRERSLSTFYDVYNSLKDIWKYCTHEYCSKIQITDSRISKCKIDVDWLLIQSCFDNYSSNCFIKREKQLSCNASSLIPAIQGYLTTIGARLNNPNFESVIDYVKNTSKSYCEDIKNLSPCEIINDKSKIYNFERSNFDKSFPIGCLQEDRYLDNYDFALHELISELEFEQENRNIALDRVHKDIQGKIVIDYTNNFSYIKY